MPEQNYCSLVLFKIGRWWFTRGWSGPRPSFRSLSLPIIPTKNPCIWLFSISWDTDFVEEYTCCCSLAGKSSWSTWEAGAQHPNRGICTTPRDSPYPQTPTYTLLALWTLVQLGTGALVCCRGWVLAWSPSCLALELHQEAPSPSK